MYLLGISGPAIVLIADSKASANVTYQFYVLAGEFAVIATKLRVALGFVVTVNAATVAAHLPCFTWSKVIGIGGA
jgi:hypothetical protein